MRNVAFGWVWVLAGMFGGLALGLGFQGSNWHGGYTSWRRRLLRLGHVALVGTGVLNIVYGLGADRLHLPPPLPVVASAAWIAGAVLMPACCALAAWRARWPAWLLFSPPVTCLLLAAGLTCWGALR